MWQLKFLNKDGTLVLVEAMLPDGRMAFYYVLCSAGNARKLHAVFPAQAAIPLESYGKVVRRGWGVPSEADKEFIRMRYNINSQA